MTDTVTLVIARNSVKSLLDRLGIKRVIFVDDQNAQEQYGLEELLGMLHVINEDSIDHAVFREIGLPSDANIAVISGYVRSRWNDFPPETRSQLFEVVRQGAQTEVIEPLGTNNPDLKSSMHGAVNSPADSLASTVLDDILGNLEEIEYEALSLSQWSKMKDHLLSLEAAKETLFLFDRSFTSEGGSENDGFDLIRTVQEIPGTYYGMITHTSTLDTEMEDWENLSREFDVDKDRFVLVTKQRLTSEPPDYLGFVRMIKLTALSRPCGEVRDDAVSVLMEAVEQTKEELKKISVFDFEQIVFSSSAREGVWELDTLYRLFHMYLRRIARTKLRSAVELDKKFVNAKQVSKIPVELKELKSLGPNPVKAWTIQRSEIYEDGIYLNTYCQPIDNGDIFEDSGSKKQYILLAQPCDLMVREGGKRSYDDADQRCGLLIELRLSVEGKDWKPSWVELPFYDADTGLPAVADLAKVETARLLVLDLCALNTDGSCTLDLDADCPSAAIDALKRRYSSMKSKFGAFLQEYTVLNNKVSPKISRLAMPIATCSGKFQIVIDERKISYGVRRIGRLNQPRSGALLTRLTQYQARAAFDHDFQEPPKPESPNACGG